MTRLRLWMLDRFCLGDRGYEWWLETEGGESGSLFPISSTVKDVA